MSAFQDLLQQYVDMPYDELLKTANQNMDYFIGDIQQKFGTQDGNGFVAVLIGVCLGIDAKLTELENKFLNDVTGAKNSYAENLKFVQQANTEVARKLVEDVVRRLPKKTRATICSFCLCFFAVDETVSKEEIAFLERLLAD